MAAIVCHGYQSRIESQLVESRIHRLRFPTPKPLTPHQPIDLPFKSCFFESNTEPHCQKNDHKSDTLNNNSNLSGWSSIEALSNVSQGLKEAAYVPPQAKRSSVRLSAKSLELCTENLGNETGTEIIESGIDMLSYKECGEREGKKSCQVFRSKKEKTKNFPPPLTTMRGLESLRVRPHREGGRLVIEATKVPSSASCFQAERSHGRLRLCLWTYPEDYEEEEEETEEAEEEDIELSPTSAKNISETKFIKSTKYSYQEQTFETESGRNSSIKKEGVEDVLDIENENGGEGRIMEKYERRSRSSLRCKEGENENSEMLLINWGEPLRVATS